MTDTQSQVSVFLNQWSDMELQEERKLCVDWEVKVQTMWDKTDQLYKTLTAFLETHRKVLQRIDAMSYLLLPFIRCIMTYYVICLI